MKRLELDDGQHLAYHDGGLQDATPLVLLHGGGLDHRMWGPQLDAFPDHRVIAPDARAHGESSTPQAPYRLVDDVVGLIEHLGLDPVVVVGLSMGGGTAIDLAEERPDLVRALVVSGTGTSEPDFRDPWVLEVFGQLQQAVEQGDPEAWISAFLRFDHGPHRAASDVDPAVRELDEQLLRHTLMTHVIPVVARGEAPVQPTPIEDVNGRRADIAVPVLAITGEVDADDHRRFTRELLDVVADGREVVVPNTAHYPNLEAPSVFNEALGSFVRDLDA